MMNDEFDQAIEAIRQCQITPREDRVIGAVVFIMRELRDGSGGDIGERASADGSRQSTVRATSAPKADVSANLVRPKAVVLERRPELALMHPAPMMCTLSSGRRKMQQRFDPLWRRTLPCVESCWKSIFVNGAALLGVLITAFIFYPGVMSPDSVDQLRQARTGEIPAEAFPPIMALVWRYADMLISGPFGMMLLHNLVFWGGLALVAGACRFGTVASALWVLGIGLFPPVFALLGILWKDVGWLPH